MSRFRSHHAIGAAALIATAALAMSGCTAPQSAAPTPGEATELKTIQFVNPLPNYPTWRLIGDCAANEAKAAGIELTESGPTGSTLDTNYMIERIQQATANKVDGIITFPSNGELFGPVVKQARDAGILVATTQGSADGEENVQVGVDWYAWGEMVAQKVSDEGGEQKVGILTTDPTPPSSDYADGFKAKAAELGNVEVIDERYTGGDNTKASSVVAAMMTGNPDLTFIVGTEGAPIQAVTTAIREAGKTGTVNYLPYGLDNGGAEGVQDGTLYATTVFNLCQIGSGAVDALVQIADGEKVDALVPIGMDIATKENVEKFIADEDWG